jgi:hypothetical protein
VLELELGLWLRLGLLLLIEVVVHVCVSAYVAFARPPPHPNPTLRARACALRCSHHVLSCSHKQPQTNQIVRKDTREENNILLRLVDGNLEAVAVMGSRVSLKPMSTNSKFHERLTKTAAVAVEKKMQRIQVCCARTHARTHTRTHTHTRRLFAHPENMPLTYVPFRSLTQVFKGTRENPDKQMERLEKTHSAAIAANRRREEKQQAERYRNQRAAPMSRDFLEEGVAHDDDDEEEEYDVGAGRAYDDDEEEEEDDAEEEAEGTKVRACESSLGLDAPAGLASAPRSMCSVLTHSFIHLFARMPAWCRVRARIAVSPTASPTALPTSFILSLIPFARCDAVLNFIPKGKSD